jgi:NodT family efflux transporter outer membrane factor (OMF) lipoprotein
MSRPRVAAALAGLIAMTACAVGPGYKRPDTPAVAAFKESPPAGWKEAQPNEGVLRGAWWEMYGDTALNAFESQVSISNQNVLAAEAQLRAAQAAVRITGADRFPTVTAAPSAAVGGGAVGSGRLYTLPVNATYQVDVWGSIRRSVEAGRDVAQATTAQLENARLLYQSELAADYFQLEGLDASRKLLVDAVASYERNLQLTQDRFTGGVASQGDVALAETQLESARAQLVDVGIARAQFEHAIAVLIGKPPADVSVPASAKTPAPPPPIPVAMPSALLERRPDIAAAERQVAAANAEVGVAKSAWYPVLTLTADAASKTDTVVNLLTLPTRFWSVGADLAATLFDGGRRRAQVALSEATYDTTVANYRQTVLTGVEQVEDNLAALRILADEAAIADRAVDAARRSLDISTTQYRGGLASYLQVITAQTSLLENQRTAADLLTRRLVASVSLIQALGGGWKGL